MSTKLEKYGLQDEQHFFILKLFAMNPNINKAILYNARDTGDFEMAANVEIAISGTKISETMIKDLLRAIKIDGPEALWFDIVNYDEIDDDLMRDFIDDNGIIIYEKETT